MFEMFVMQRICKMLYVLNTLHVLLICTMPLPKREVLKPAET